MFLIKVVLKICNKFRGEHPCRSVILIKLLCDFIEITLQRGCSPGWDSDQKAFLLHDPAVYPFHFCNCLNPILFEFVGNKATGQIFFFSNIFFSVFEKKKYDFVLLNPIKAKKCKPLDEDKDEDEPLIDVLEKVLKI